MKRLLLDTHAFLWWISDSSKLGSQSRQLIANPTHEVYVSAASILEIAIKKQIGKLQAPENLAEIIEEEGFLPLSITPSHGEQTGQLPFHHRDPFDRLLIAQCQCENLELLTCDSKIPLYQVRVQNASK